MIFHNLEMDQTNFPSRIVRAIVVSDDKYFQVGDYILLHKINESEVYMNKSLLASIEQVERSKGIADGYILLHLKTGQFFNKSSIAKMYQR